MKNYLLMLIGLFCAFLTKAQNNPLSEYMMFEKQIFLDKDIYGPHDIQYSKSSNSNELAITFYNTKYETDTVCIYILNTNTDSISMEKYYVENLNQSLVNNYAPCLSNIALCNNYITFITQKFFYLVDRKDKKVITKISNTSRFRDASFIDNNKIFIYTNYNYHPLDKKEKTHFALFSIPKFKLIKEEYPKFEYIQYTHIKPSHWVSCLNGKILFSQTLDYRIELYNQNLKPEKTIFLPENYTWISPDDNQKESIKKTEAALDAIDEVLKYENQIDRIIGVYWLSDTSFIVNKNHGIGKNENNKNFELLFDIWKFRNNDWILDKYNIEDKTLEEIKLENMEFSLFSGRFERNYIFINDYIYLLTFSTPIPLNSYSTENYIQESNEYLYENSPVFQIIKFKHTLND